jgi:tetratricopeptide (TPR) repeat protein
VGIDVFDVDSSVELLGKIVGTERVLAERAATAELVSVCDGLPLALRIAGARLAARPHWRIDELVGRLRDEAHRLDELAHHGLELRSNIGLTYRSLTEPAQRLFRLFGMLAAPDFPAWTAAALLDTDRYLAEELVESLVEAQLLEAHRGRYRFHDLVRVYAKELLLKSESDGERRAALARVLGGWLSLAEQAHRRDHGGDYTILHGRAPRWRAPAEVIVEPMDWWEGERRAVVAAVRQAAAAGMDELCWDLAHTSVTLFEAKGYFDDWLETTRLALETVVAAGNRPGEAVMRYSLGTLRLFQKRLDEAESHFAAALELFDATGNRHGRGLVLRNAAYIDGLRGNTADMHAKYIEALDILRAVDDRIGEAHILRSLAKFEIDSGDMAGAEELLEESLDICLDTRCRRSEAQVRYRFGQLYARTDRVDEAVEALLRTLRLVRELGDPIGQAYALYELGTVYQREGRPEAEPTLTEARQAFDLIGVPIADR